MRILLVASYNRNRFAPFIMEQADALQHAGCEIEWFGVTKKGLIGYMQEIPRLRRKIREGRPNIIHAHYGLSCLLANMATRRIPVVSTYHGSDINNPTVRRFSRIAMRLSAWNIFVSLRNVDIAKPKRRWSLIPCGINLPESWGELQNREVAPLTHNQGNERIFDRGKKHVLFAGAFDNTVKDPELAMAAVARVKSEKLRDSSEELELIELKGYNRDQVNALMYNCDAFLMTSKTEGSPQVIKEAMACGCPIVSVDVGDVAERTEGVEGCYIVSSREPKYIADAIVKAIMFSGKTNGRERIVADGLTNEQVAARIMNIYANIAK